MAVNIELMKVLEGWPEVMAVVESTCGSRRTKQEMAAVDRAIQLICEEYESITVRQLFYQLVSRGVIPKTEKAYKGSAVRRSGELRRAGVIPYGKFADATRWQRKPTTYGGLWDALYGTVFSYRRELWASQDTYVEVWCEKDALAGVIYPITEKYDVALMVARGYSSLSFLHSAAEEIIQQHKDGKSVVLYHLGDLDPSGQDAARAVRDTLQEMTDVPFEFHQLAVTHDQVAQYDLPERPTKTTDSRAKGWVGGSVELDAIDPKTLQGLVEDALMSHINQDELEVTQRLEVAERDALKEFVDNYEMPIL